MALSRHPYLTITALQRSFDPYLCQPLCVKTLLPVWFVQPILAFTLTHILLSYVNSNLTRLQPLLYGLFAPSHRMLYFKDDADSEMITEKYVLKKRRWLAGALEVTVADLQWHIQTEFNHKNEDDKKTNWWYFCTAHELHCSHLHPGWRNILIFYLLVNFFCGINQYLKLWHAQLFSILQSPPFLVFSKPLHNCTECCRLTVKGWVVK